MTAEIQLVYQLNYFLRPSYAGGTRSYRGPVKGVLLSLILEIQGGSYPLSQGPSIVCCYFYYPQNYLIYISYPWNFPVSYLLNP